ncbi:NUDIX domain-containing protein [Rhizobium herbae]|uniref:NUDIX domain-containing protein n=2 Tax=Rhizobium herbae TaxID=508661 RepID=A0ABS7H9N4_9HYPH|nr:NUDIX domain-containing protein [Rhizobium herbae]MBW9063921.1 NUDIX domain-containing protein [Rhizobium herbae]
MDDTARKMIVMDAGVSRFQLRAGALIWATDHILVHRAVGDPYWSLPGGRVELDESSEEALAREIDEELGCTATVGRLRFVIENFFELDGRKAHELGFYFDAELSRPLPFHESEIIHRVRDGNSDLEFRWALPTATTLHELDLKPRPLRDLIAAKNADFAHLVYRDVP